jgi:hypothetical protein
MLPAAAGALLTTMTPSQKRAHEFIVPWVFVTDITMRRHIMCMISLLFNDTVDCRDHKALVVDE